MHGKLIQFWFLSTDNCPAAESTQRVGDEGFWEESTFNLVPLLRNSQKEDLFQIHFRILVRAEPGAPLRSAKTPPVFQVFIYRKQPSGGYSAPRDLASSSSKGSHKWE